MSVGDELLSGRIADTNAAWLAARLGPLGLPVSGVTVVGDAERAVAAALRAAARRSPVVVVTGGLGPTRDDLTREALAAAFRLPLREDPVALRSLAMALRRIGRPLGAQDRRQSLAPEGAEVLANPVGTAPGLCLERGGSRIFLLPGVPSEMERMFLRAVVPRLRRAWPAARGVAGVCTRRLQVWGVPESRLDTILGDCMERGTDPTVGLRVWAGGVEVSVSSRDRSRVGRTVQELRRRLGEAVYRVGGHGEDSLAAATLTALARRHWSLATAESCTGGLLGQLITEVPGASQVYRGGVVAYADDVKQGLLGVPRGVLERHGAVSEAVALAMARGARERLGAEVALAITGVAGPGGGTRAKPVGTVWTALHAPGLEEASRRRHLGTRAEVRLRAAMGVLDRARRWALGPGAVGVVAAFLALSAPARGDTIRLANGGTLEGRVVHRSERGLVVSLGGFGRVYLRPEEVLGVEADERDGSGYGAAAEAGVGRSDWLRTAPRPVPGTAGPPSTLAPAGGAPTGEDPYRVPEVVLDPAVQAEAMAALLQLARQDPRAHNRARNQLLGMGPDVLPLATPYLTHPVEKVQRSVIALVKAAGYKPAVPRLIGLLEDEDETVRADAAGALQDLTGQDLDYDAARPQRQRSEAVGRWRAWWEAEQARHKEASASPGGGGAPGEPALGAPPEGGPGGEGGEPR
ncbi:MAG: CinA family nicotinamide mononucleotide deamidase-related protein [Planctomycetes bacterium]|nr:CinA family nicotinamide mononucleotide deamidase-related protein [Planctomycetota bacterium]